MSVMIDLETWGTSPGSAIRSIGAVIFSERSQEEYEIGEDPASTFYRNVDDSTSLGVRSPSTVQWWSQQSDDAIRAFEAPKPIPEREALESLASFACGHGCVWANDPDFDCVILKSMYDAHGIRYPFAFWSHRSVRTALSMGGIGRSRYAPLVAHHALQDAIAQARRVRAAYRKLGLNSW